MSIAHLIRFSNNFFSGWHFAYHYRFYCSSQCGWYFTSNINFYRQFIKSLIITTFTRGLDVRIDSSVIQKKYKELGPITFEEKATGLLLLFTIFLWIFRNPPGCSEEAGCGWEEMFHQYKEWYGVSSGLLSDTTAVLFTALFLFFIPAKNAAPGTKLLSWDIAEKEIPWDILLLIGTTCKFMSVIY